MNTKKSNGKLHCCALILLLCILAATVLTFLLLLTNNFHLKEVTEAFTKKATKYQNDTNARLVCYYVAPDPEDNATNTLRLAQIDAQLCTHINIGMSLVADNASIIISDHLKQVLSVELPALRQRNDKIKLLLWVGGGGGTSNGFAKMVVKHDTRKKFIRSLKEILRAYKLDGIDLDWEFPSAYNKERMHFSQLLYELREEFKRERRDYLLSIAVAAVEGIALFAYDIREINLYADYVNLMSYDYHFYSKSTPFTGLNAPLYARDKEHSILATLNINYSVNWWLTQGLERQKLVVGLPTYGHSFTLVNPFNNGIGAPASDFGSCGQLGFTTYSDVCWFITHNVGIKTTFDTKAVAPYLSSGNEWISYENETSIMLKTKYIRSLNVGGVMAFSLNTDDVYGYCLSEFSKTAKFPLIATINKYLFEEL